MVKEFQRAIEPVKQAIGGEQHSVVYGKHISSSQSDEGTENQASEWSPDSNLSNDAGDKQVGSYSLKWTTVPQIPGQPYEKIKIRTLGSPFVWGDFVEIRIWIKAGVGWRQVSYVEFYAASYKKVMCPISGFTPGGGWIELTFNKNDFIVYGISATSTITKQALRLYGYDTGVSREIWFDGFDIDTATYVPLKVDATGILSVVNA